MRSAPGLQRARSSTVAPGRKGAWITLVGLPAERRFGARTCSVGGERASCWSSPSPEARARMLAWRPERGLAYTHAWKFRWLTL